MTFNFVQILLVAVVTFLAAMDQFSLTETLYRPIILGPVVGAILGDINVGLVVGGSYELMMVGSMPVGGAQPANSVLGCIMAVVFAISTGADTNSALGLSIPFALLGQYCVILVFTVTSFIMAKADAYAAEANPKGITTLNWVTMSLLGLFFALVASAGLVAGGAIGETLTKVFPQFVWTGLGAAGGMMRFVGFAVLLKIMLSNDLWGIYFAGFGLAVIIEKAGLGGQGLLLVAFIGIAIAIYDYQANVKVKSLGGKGGNSDGI